MNRFTSPKSMAVLSANLLCYLVFHLLHENTSLHFDETDVSALQGFATSFMTMLAPHTQANGVSQS